MQVYTDINDEIIKLVIYGYVIPTPGKLRAKIGPLDAGMNSIDFGELYQDSIVNETISLFNPGDVPIQIIPKNEPEYITVSIEPQIIEPGHSAELFLEMNTAACDMGEMFTVCNFEISLNEKILYSYISVLAVITEDFSKLTEWEIANPPLISPILQRVDLGIIAPNVTTTKEIEIENKGLRELLIHNISASNSMYSINPKKLRIEPGETNTFNISITPTPTRNNVFSKLTITSNDPDNRIISLSIKGIVEQSTEVLPVFSIGNLEVAEAVNLIRDYEENDDFIILDVRPENEYKDGFIKGAVNIDLADPEFRKKMDSLDRKKTYLVYCAFGLKSRQAADLMLEMGFEEIYHIPDGIEGWKTMRMQLSYPDKKN